MAATEENVSATGVEETIGRVENLYRSMTGKNPPPIGDVYSPIPVERDPAKFVEEQLDRLLMMLSPVGSPGIGAAASWSPPLVVWENESEFLVCADLPGVTRKDVEVTLDERSLTIKGHRPAPLSADHRLRACEGPFGPFVRRLVMPPSIRGLEPNAHIKDGVLEIRILKDKSANSGPRTIPVN